MHSLVVAYGRFLFRYRNYLFPLVLLALIGASALDGRSAPGWAAAAGTVLVLAGAVLRVAVVGLAYIKRGGVDKRVYARDLVTEGLFAHCRNPLYVGNLLTLAGYFVIPADPWVALAGALFFLTAYRAIVATEEDYLTGRFGAAYARYCRDVPRWAFKPGGLVGTFSAMRFNWRRVLVKEYGSLAATGVTLSAILAFCRAVDPIAAGTVALTCVALAALVSFLKHYRGLKTS